MTYAEFLARHASVNDAECATVVMGWKLHESPGACDPYWYQEDRLVLTRFVADFSPTTDRNATDLLLAEVERRGLVLKTLSTLLDDDSIASTTWGCLRAAPSLVAWACVEACREGRCQQ